MIRLGRIANIVVNEIRHNLHRIRAKYELPATEYCFFLALTMAYKSAQAALGRA